MPGQQSISQKPAAVIFDTDNTLYEYKTPHAKALQATRDKAKKILGITENEFDDAYNKARHAIKQQLGETASSHSRLLYFQRLIEYVGLKTQLLHTLDLEQTYWRTFLTSCELFGGVKEFLEDLRRLAIPTAIITDLTSQIQFRKIIYFGLEQHFDFVITSEESGRDKPDASGFLLAKQKLDIQDGQIWMIGDDPLTDLDGAKRHLGAVTFQRRNKDGNWQSNVSQPDVLFSSFWELSKHLGRFH